MDSPGAWKYGLVPQAMANGLSSILVIFYVLTELGGGLIGVGLVAGVSALALIPSQIVWGRLVDSMGRVRPFLVLGFLGMGLTLFMIPWITTLAGVLVLVGTKSAMYAATLPSRQLLIVESEGRDGWRKALANMQFLSAIGETVGMGLGALLVSVLGFGELFTICAILCLVSAGALGTMAREPGMMIQRRLVAMERTTSTLVEMSGAVGLEGPGTTTHRIALKMLTRSSRFLLLGIFCFALAGSAFYSPLPAYFLEYYSSSTVFSVLFVGSLVGAICYLAVGNRGGSAGASLTFSSSTRMMVIPLLLLSGLGANVGLLSAVAVLAVLEAVWSLFDVSSLFAFMETAQVGQAGVYGALMGLGTAAGGFLGGFVSMRFGFVFLFILSGAICGGALLSFVAQFRVPSSSEY